MMNELIQTYLLPILATALTSLAGYLGLKIKNVYEKYINDKVKKDVVESTVKCIEQIYNHLSGEEKLNLAISNITEILNSKNIQISDLELRVLIEATCNSFKKSLKGE